MTEKGKLGGMQKQNEKHNESEGMTEGERQRMTEWGQEGKKNEMTVASLFSSAHIPPVYSERCWKQCDHPHGRESLGYMGHTL